MLHILFPSSLSIDDGLFDILRADHCFFCLCSWHFISSDGQHAISRQDPSSEGSHDSKKKILEMAAQNSVERFFAFCVAFILFENQEFAFLPYTFRTPALAVQRRILMEREQYLNIRPTPISVLVIDSQGVALAISSLIYSLLPASFRQLQAVGWDFDTTKSSQTRGFCVDRRCKLSFQHETTMQGTRIGKGASKPLAKSNGLAGASICRHCSRSIYHSHLNVLSFPVDHVSYGLIGELNYEVCTVS
jgi:hypothetical protein